MVQVRNGSATIPLTGRRMRAFAERGARHPSSNTAIASFERGTEPRVRHQPEGGR